MNFFGMECNLSYNVSRSSHNNKRSRMSASLDRLGICQSLSKMFIQRNGCAYLHGRGGVDLISGGVHQVILVQSGPLVRGHLKGQMQKRLPQCFHAPPGPSPFLCQDVCDVYSLTVFGNSRYGFTLRSIRKSLCLSALGCSSPGEGILNSLFTSQAHTHLLPSP